jgi:hypothetical protein
MNGSSGSVELVMTVNELWSTTGGGGKSCGVERLVLGARFIHRRGARRSIREWKRPVAVGASLGHQFSSICSLRWSRNDWQWICH